MDKTFTEDLKSLKGRCENFSDDILILDGWEDDLVFQESSEIDASGSDWRIFVLDTEEFLKNYHVDEADNIRRLLYAEHINERVLSDLAVCLHRAGIQATHTKPAKQIGFVVQN